MLPAYHIDGGLIETGHRRVVGSSIKPAYYDRRSGISCVGYINLLQSLSLFRKVAIGCIDGAAPREVFEAVLGQTDMQ